MSYVLRKTVTLSLQMPPLLSLEQKKIFSSKNNPFFPFRGMCPPGLQPVAVNHECSLRNCSSRPQIIPISHFPPTDHPHFPIYWEEENIPSKGHSCSMVGNKNRQMHSFHSLDPSTPHSSQAFIVTFIVVTSIWGSCPGSVTSALDLCAALKLSPISVQSHRAADD